MAFSHGELVSVNPATLDEVGRVAVTPPEAIGDIVGEARSAQEHWGRTTSGERRALLTAVAEVLVEDADELAHTITHETGKPLLESYLHDVFTAAECVAWLARAAGRVLASERVGVPFWLRHKRARTVHEPLGVIGVISPWNLPFAVPLTQAATAVAAGNAVVVKPSERAGLTGAWVERAFERAGAARGLVGVVQGAADTGEALVRCRGVGKVLVTGSAATGRAVARVAAERLGAVTLELGGRDPMVVFADADGERAVAGALWSAFSNCGQLCSGVERIYVERAAYEPFVEDLARRARALRVGRGDDLATDVGPLVAEEQRARVEALVADAVDRGGDVRAGGERPAVGLPGWFYEPTVLAGGAARDEELFGPVVTVEPFAGEDEAVRLANASRFGLGASVWTSDRDRARRVARSIEAGMVWTNDHSYSYGVGGAPWGGTKASGFGRTHSRHGLYDVSSPKLVDRDSGRVPVPWWYPYDEGGVEAFSALLPVLHRPGVAAKVAAAWAHRGGLARLAARYVSVR